MFPAREGEEVAEAARRKGVLGGERVGLSRCRLLLAHIQEVRGCVTVGVCCERQTALTVKPDRLVFGTNV